MWLQTGGLVDGNVHEKNGAGGPATKEEKTMNNYKNKVWPIVAGIIFALTAIGTVGLMMKVAGLNMLPTKYFGLAIFAVVFLLALIFAFFFLLPWKKKEEKAENTETVENTAKKPVAKYVLRTIAMILAIALACVDVVGMQMIHKFEETMSNLSQGPQGAGRPQRQWKESWRH